MAATVELTKCNLQIRTQDGTLPSGKPRIKSYSLTGVDEQATATKLINVSDAIGSVIANPVVDTYRIDTNLVDPGE